MIHLICSKHLGRHTIYIGDPQRVAAIFPSCKNRANPKSAIDKKNEKFIYFFYSSLHIYIYIPILSVIFDGAGKVLQLCDSKIFCGFRSRCTIPLTNNARIAPASCIRNNRIVSSLNVPFTAK